MGKEASYKNVSDFSHSCVKVFFVLPSKQRCEELVNLFHQLLTLDFKFSHVTCFIKHLQLTNCLSVYRLFTKL